MKNLEGSLKKISVKANISSFFVSFAHEVSRAIWVEDALV